MPEQKATQDLKLRDSIIREACSLIAFLTENSNTYVCLLYHVDIVGTISDGQGNCFLHVILHDLCDLSLLPRRTSVYDYRAALFNDF